MDRILLIGGSGFIGSNITTQLIRNNYKVFILELPGSDISIFESIPNNLKIYYGRLSDYDIIKDIINENSIDTVIHLASSLLPSSSFESYLLEFDSIIKPTIKLLQLFSDLNTKLVYFSSGGTVYGNGNNAFSEFHKTEPISYYGQSKLIIEESIKFENRRLGLKYLIIRPSNPYGIGQKINGQQGLIATSIGHILNNEKISIWGDGNVVRDYIHIDDLVKGLIKILENEFDDDIFNIGSGIGYSINEIINVLRKCVDKDFEVEYFEGRKVDVPNLVLNVEKFEDVFKTSKISIEQGIKDFYIHELKKIKNN
jgi:UDP-glucose 4-epimerase